MKIIFLLFFVLFFISSVLALDCQYIELEPYKEEVEFFYHNQGLVGENINLFDFITLEVRGLEIKASNNFDYPITLFVEYRRDSKWFGVSNDIKNVTFNIGKKDFEIHEDSFKYTVGCPSLGCSISLIKPSILTFAEPNIIWSEKKVVDKNRTICKMCDTDICLNDGASCNPLYDDGKCGSRVCNIAGFCGKEKVVDCPSGKLNCQDKICLEPSTKEEGESYMCSFECKSDRFEEGVCLKSSRDRTIFWIIILIGSSILIWFFAFYRRKKAKKDYDFFKNKVNELEKREKELDLKINSGLKEIEKIDIFLKEGRDKINHLKEEIRCAEGKAKKELERRLKIEEQNEKERISKLENQKKRLSLDEKKLKIIRENFQNENKQFFIQRAIDKYKQRYSNIYYDKKEGYIKFLSPGNKPLHRYLYEKRIEKNIKNKDIHHIDGDKLNNEDWNLIAINRQEHEDINHASIDFRDWESGIKELKRALNWDDSDLPEHIQKEIEKRKQQKRLEKYARKSRRSRR